MSFAVFGSPIAHSKSPELFHTLFENFPYIRISCDNPKQVKKLIFDLELEGANLTSPLKKTILPLLDEVDPLAKHLGSVNTIKRKGKKLFGYNTDTFGVANSLKKMNLDVKNRRCLVLGSGGAAAAVCSQLGSAKDVVVVSRTIENAQALAELFGFRTEHIGGVEKISASFDFIFYTLTKEAKNPIKIILPHQIFLDSNYSSTKNSFAQNWLIFQALAAYEIFFESKLPPKSEEKLLDASDDIFYKKPVRSISINGFMGVGKSTTCKLLAKELSLKHIDLDDCIERKKMLKIESIFRNYGEEHFRRIESETLLEVLLERHCFCLATGGGTLADSQNASLLKKQTFPIWLFSDIKTILSRVKNRKKRPLFSSDGRKLSSLYQKRQQSYLANCHLAIDVRQLNKFQLCKKVMSELCSIGFARE